MVVNFLVKYLGIPLGAEPRKVATWRPIIDKIEKKLNGWNSMINSLLLYFLGLFKMPSQVARKIISLHNRFF